MLIISPVSTRQPLTSFKTGQKRETETEGQRAIKRDRNILRQRVKRQCEKRREKERVKHTRGDSETESERDR